MKLDDFLKRKKVRCINRDNHGCLTENKVYDVIGAIFGRLKIRNDNGDNIWYDMTCFKLVIESAENQLQDMKLTPETEASEPKFKVGDKVYFGTDPDIKTISHFERASFKAFFTASSSSFTIPKLYGTAPALSVIP